MIFQQPPPFEPTEVEAISLINLGYMFSEILILILFMFLMIYLYRKMLIKGYLSILIVFLFSLLIGFESMTHFHTHFSPYFELFFLLFQLSIFLLSVIEYYNYKKGK